jgi:hypothetical protein
MSEIKWAYHVENGTISALPASPWLLPALGILCLAPLVAKLVEQAERDPQPLPENFDPILFNDYRKIYRALMHKKASGIELSTEESLRLQTIAHPPWAKPGEIWSY